MYAVYALIKYYNNIARIYMYVYTYMYNCTKPPLTLQVMGVSVTQYALLYSLYSWPNVILSVFGGYLIDRVFGVRVGTIVFSSFVCLGQVNNNVPGYI